MRVTLYSDGSARGNPDGPGGFGTILHYVNPQGKVYERELSAGYKKTTNNRMELMGVITGLEALTKPCDVDVISDSKYVTDAFNQMLLAAMEPHHVTFHWVKGHAGHPENERCDKLATTAADGDGLLDDILHEMV